MSRETIAVIDFGGQTSQLIARRVRDNNVHSVLCGPAVTAAHGTNNGDSEQRVNSCVNFAEGKQA